MPAYSGAYVMLPVANMRRAADFYRGLLDLEPLTESETWSEFVLGAGVTLALHAGMRVPAASGLGFYVDDLDAMCAAAENAGGRVLAPPHDLGSGLRAATVSDPDGNALILTQA